ncbi:MAG: PH domain-containing protein [Saprospiraceae bacterium]
MDFKASMDIKTYVITASVILLIFALSNVTSWMSEDHVLNQWFVMGLPVFCLLILVIVYGFSIKSYTLTADQLIIRRPFKDAVYQRNELADCEMIDQSASGFALRLFGSGGFFGYFGIFTNKQLGRYTLYGTQLKNYVGITLKNGKKIVITPDLPEEFVAQLKLV